MYSDLYYVLYLLQVGRKEPWAALANVFNDPDIKFDNFFIDHPTADEELLEMDPNDFNVRPASFLKGRFLSFLCRSPRSRSCIAAALLAFSCPCLPFTAVAVPLPCVPMITLMHYLR
jgi:hypothetical protein